VSWYILGQFGWALVLLTVAIDRYIARRTHTLCSDPNSQPRLRPHPRLSSTLGHASLFSAYITWTLLNIGGISDR
jgi:hypothetical protein